MTSPFQPLIMLMHEGLPKCSIRASIINIAFDNGIFFAVMIAAGCGAFKWARRADKLIYFSIATTSSLQLYAEISSAAMLEQRA